MRRFVGIALAIGFLVISARTAEAQNIVKNGSFETPTFPSGPVWPWPVPTGWTSTTGEFEVWTNTTTPAAFDGRAFLELDVNHNSSIYQDLATKVGVYYFVGFAMANRSPGSYSGIDVLWNGVSLFPSPRLTSSLDWIYLTSYVASGSSTTRLTLVGSGPSDGYGDFLDAVCVGEFKADGSRPDCGVDASVAPEPASLALMASGLVGMLGVARLRRRSM